jgi:hypothetical protein
MASLHLRVLLHAGKNSVEPTQTRRSREAIYNSVLGNNSVEPYNIYLGL